MAGNYATDEQIDALEEEVANLLTRIAELEAALKPFADEAQRIDDEYVTGSELEDDETPTCRLTIGDLRQARKVLGEKEDNFTER